MSVAASLFLLTIHGNNQRGRFLEYPWYDIVKGEELQQGDIIRQCPIFRIPEVVLQSITSDSTSEIAPEIEFESRDVIIMSQSCDMDNEDDRKPIAEVLLCAIWQRSEISEGPMASKDNWNHAIKERLPNFHVLKKCDISGHEREISVVDFRRIYSLPTETLRSFVSNSGGRIRLQPPFREHLSQAFARQFMRVGLPRKSQIELLK